MYPLSVDPQNCTEGKLTEEQICLAFSALIQYCTQRDHGLALLCVNRLITATTDASSPSAIRLRLALISIIQIVDQEVLPLVLDKVETTLQQETDPKAKRALMDATKREVWKGNQNPKQQERIMKWWFRLEGALSVEAVEARKGDHEVDSTGRERLEL